MVQNGHLFSISADCSERPRSERATALAELRRFFGPEARDKFVLAEIHVGYGPIASSRVPLHVARSGRVGDASSVMDDLCPVNLLSWLG